MNLQGSRVLIVEDEPIIAFGLEDMLAGKCESITIASTLAQAASELELKQFDLAILDVNVNGQDSYSFARVLVERSIPFVFATGYGNALHPEEMADVPTVAKPYNIGDLERTAALVG